MKENSTTTKSSNTRVKNYKLGDPTVKDTKLRNCLTTSGMRTRDAIHYQSTKLREGNDTRQGKPGKCHLETGHVLQATTDVHLASEPARTAYWIKLVPELGWANECTY